MIVEINSNWRSDHQEEELTFFKENGKAEPNEHGKDAEKKIYWTLKYIGHIETVPLSILNSSTYTIQYYRGMKAMVDTYLGGGHEKVQRLTGGAINVHLPSMELMSIKEVTWMEDACTQSLQERINEGWMIVACIPRPGQRRPDYVLGKNKRSES